MSFDGTDPCWLPDTPVGRDDEWRLRVAQYGDGYAQRTLEGINALDMTWKVTFTNREPAVLNAMLDFLVAEKASAFLFLEQQTGRTYKVFCDKWSVSWDIRRRGGVYYGTLSAEFVKANGVTI